MMQTPVQTEDNAPFHIVQVQAWIQKGDQFLLARRSDKELQAGGLWALPGGKVEHEGRKSNILQGTLRQEIREEVGLEVDDQMAIIANAAFVRKDGAPVVSLTFLCQWASGQAQPLEDTAEVGWFTLDQLLQLADAPEYLVRYIKALQDYLDQAALA